MGTAVGSVILALVVNGMNLLGVQTFWQTAVLGTIILFSVLWPTRWSAVRDQ